MQKQEIIAKLETIAQNLYAVRLPVQEAGAYSKVLTSANEIAMLAKKMREDADNDGYNQPE